MKEQEKKRKRNKDRSRREMEYRDELFSGKEGFLGPSLRKQSRKEKKRNKKQPKDLRRMYFVSPRSQEYHTKYDANLYKKAMLMVSII